ncbi:respiratory nitrate reductase subunit gamma [Staphylococcus aureus]
MLNQFLWVIFPYLCLVVFVAGHIARYRYDKFSWTAKSSELIERKRLMWGSLLFHLGIIPVFFGHVVGLLIPKSWMDAVGVSEHLYHIGAVYIGSIFGIITLIGMFFINSETCYYEKYSKIKFSVGYICKFLIITYRIYGMLRNISNQYTTSRF